MPFVRVLILVWQVPVHAGDTGSSFLSFEKQAELRLGSRIVLLELWPGGSRATNLTSSFEATGRPNLSFDGRRVLFAGSRSEQEVPSVWELNLQERTAQEVVRHAAGCYDPLYLSTTYTMNATAPVAQVLFRAGPSANQPASFFTCQTNGANVQQITFSPGGVSDALLLSDGRLLFTMLAARPSHAVQSAARGDIADARLCGTLCTINTDGTDLFPFGYDGASLAYSQPCESTGGDVVFVAHDSTTDPATGHLILASGTNGRRWRRIASIDMPHRDPTCWDEGGLLVSAYDRGSFSLFLINADTGDRLARVFDDTAWHDMGACVVRSRPQPPGHSSVVNPLAQFGQLYGLDANRNDERSAETENRPPARRLRVVEGEGHSVLGEVPLESDGSFSIEVPARTPLRFETVSDDGRVLRQMQSWTWVMPKETRGCIGCHENRQRSPMNRHVYALRKPAIRLAPAPPVESTAPTRNKPVEPVP